MRVRPTNRRRWFTHRLLIMIVALALLVAACGGDDADGYFHRSHDCSRQSIADSKEEASTDCSSRYQSSMFGAHNASHNVRHDESNKSNGAGNRDSGTHKEGTGCKGDRHDALWVHAQGCGGIGTGRKGVEVAPQIDQTAKADQRRWTCK